MDENYFKNIENMISRLSTVINAIDLQPVFEATRHIEKVISKMEPTLTQIAETQLKVSDQVRQMTESISRYSISPEFLATIKSIGELVINLNAENTEMSEVRETIEADHIIEIHQVISSTQDFENQQAIKLSADNIKQIINFIIMVLPILIALYSNHQGTVNHEEQMQELKRQTEIQEKILSLEEERHLLETDFYQNIEQTLELLNYHLQDEELPSGDR